MNKINHSILFLFACVLVRFSKISSHMATKRLYDDLLSDYNHLIRPTSNHSHKLIVNLSLKLTQLIDINMKQQVMSTNVWVGQSWYDYKLSWDPNAYEGVDMIHVSAENIWQPDIVLFNNADGNYEVTLMTKALVYHTGEVVWKPPAMYKSTCEIDVEWFPFDVQSCLMKFGSWTYDGLEVDLRHLYQEEGTYDVAVGIDMSEFYKSVEWDILKVPARYTSEYLDCCNEPYPHITFNITMRRKTLFYTVNLIIPVVGISFLTLLVFYLPSDSGEKVTLSISILVSLTLFFLLLAEIIPPTSLAVPLLGKYLLFTMILVTLSICVTVGVLNVHFRSPSTHKMSPWIKKVFLQILPKLLFIKRPSKRDLAEELANAAKSCKSDLYSCNGGSTELAFRKNTNRNGYKGFRTAFDDDIPGLPAVCQLDQEPEYFSSHLPNAINTPSTQINWTNVHDSSQQNQKQYSFHPQQQPQQQQQTHNHLQQQIMSEFYSPEVQKAIESIIFIADHLKKEDAEKNVIEDWKFVAMVLDRLFLWIFSIACIVGSCGIIFQAPALYDKTDAIDSQLSQIGR